MERELQGIVRASGGRAYVPENTVELSPIYDDVMENMKVWKSLPVRLVPNLLPPCLLTASSVSRL